jgi:CheY-like chemotaxis protein
MDTDDSPSLLQVDDNPADLDLLQIALGDCRPDVAHLGFTRADAALAYLEQRVDAGAGLPSLIVVDLNMPLMPGQVLLARLKQHPALREVPVVIYTSSQRPAELDACIRLGAAAVLSKAGSYESLIHTVRALLLHAPTVPPGR